MLPIQKSDAIESDYFHAGACVTLQTPRNATATITETWRANGQLKTWKTRPDDFKLPIKYGLRECWYLTNDNAHSFHRSDQCQPTIFMVHAIRPALDVLKQVKRDQYRVGSAPRAEHYHAALERANLLCEVHMSAPSV